MTDKTCGIYIHIPFCRRKCRYCDFVSYAGKENLFALYTAALNKEIVCAAEFLKNGGFKVKTIYFGGGTPTALPQDDLTGLIESARFKLPLIDDEIELAIEANPGTIDESYLAAIRQAGANRLSLGVQSFDDRLLKNIGRIHSGDEALKAVAAAQKARFQNISIDLMYGLPGQKLTDLRQSLETALNISPQIKHISVYGLTLEEGTPLWTMEQRGELTGDLALPDDDAVAEMYEYIVAELPRRGYQRYEISNFALPGYESRHNFGYWAMTPYLGLGAGAHSYWINAEHSYGCRFSHGTSVEEYIKDVGVQIDKQILTRNDAIEETAILSLRTAKGISRQKFKEKFGVEIEEIYGKIIANFVEKNLLEYDEAGKFLHLTERGMEVGNVVWQKFLLERSPEFGERS